MDKITVKEAIPGVLGSGEHVIEEVVNPLEEINIDFYRPKCILYLNEILRQGKIPEGKTWPTFGIGYIREVGEKEGVGYDDYVITHEPMPGLITALEIYPYRIREKKVIAILRFNKGESKPVPIYCWDYRQGGWKSIEDKKNE